MPIKTKAHMIANFIGERGTMGYFPGMEYVLEITEDRESNNLVKVIDISQELPTRKPGKPIEYVTMFGFLKNWKLKTSPIILKQSKI